VGRSHAHRRASEWNQGAWWNQSSWLTLDKAKVLGCQAEYQIVL
jgi:hypothetical protein